MGQYITSQILSGLCYLRNNKIVHRDLKPANIVLNEHYQCKLADFGTAKRVVSSAISSNSASAVSEISFVSGLSSVSYLSGISGGALSSNSQPTEKKSMLAD